MKITGAILAALAPAAAGSVLRGLGQNSGEGEKNELLVDMHPDVVAKLLKEVEHSWVQGRVAAVRTGDKARKTTARAEMLPSCVRIAKSIVKGSEGDQNRVSLYMNTVCEHLQGDKEAEPMCTKFGGNIVKTMKGDQSYNRNNLDMVEFCDEFYEFAVVEQAGTAAAAKSLDEAIKADEEKEAKAAAGASTHLEASVDEVADAKEALHVQIDGRDASSAKTTKTAQKEVKELSVRDKKALALVQEEEAARMAAAMGGY